MVQFFQKKRPILRPCEECSTYCEIKVAGKMEDAEGLFWDNEEGVLKILFGFPNCFMFEEGLDGNLGRFPAEFHAFFEVVG
jgi:hypothetical protein